MNARLSKHLRRQAEENTVGQSKRLTKLLARRLRKAIKRGQKTVWLD